MDGWNTSVLLGRPTFRENCEFQGGSLKKSLGEILELEEAVWSKGDWKWNFPGRPQNTGVLNVCGIRYFSSSFTQSLSSRFVFIDIYHVLSVSARLIKCSCVFSFIIVHHFCSLYFRVMCFSIVFVFHVYCQNINTCTCSQVLTLRTDKFF